MNRRQFLGVAAGVGSLNLLKPLSVQAKLAGDEWTDNWGGSQWSFSKLESLGKRSFRFLTNDPSYVDARPVFSPDGKYVLFMRSPVDSPNVSSFWFVPTQGGDAVSFYENADLQATRPDWSRNRRSFQIAFTGESKDGLGLYLLDLFTRNIEVILLPGHHKWSYPSWYPDGAHLAISNYDDSVHQVVKTDLKGNLAPLTDPHVVWAGMSSVSQTMDNPITFAGQDPALGPPPPPDGYDQDTNQIWIQEPGGSPFHIDDKQGRAPWWSPCGRFIAFESNRASSHLNEYLIFIYSRLDGSVAPLTPFGMNVQHAKWSHDSKDITFAVGFTGGGRNRHCGPLTGRGWKCRLALGMADNSPVVRRSVSTAKLNL